MRARHRVPSVCVAVAAPHATRAPIIAQRVLSRALLTFGTRTPYRQRVSLRGPLSGGRGGGLVAAAPPIGLVGWVVRP